MAIFVIFVVISENKYDDDDDELLWLDPEKRLPTEKDKFSKFGRGWCHSSDTNVAQQHVRRLNTMEGTERC